MKRDHDCSSIGASLPDFAAGRLADDREAAVDAHLAGCPACRARGAALDPSLIFLELRARAPLPDAFWIGFDARLRARVEEESRRPAARFRLPAVPRFALVAGPVALALALVLGVLLTDGDRRGGAPPAVPVPAALAFTPGIEEVASPTARVYRFTVGGPEGEAPIDLIVDETLDL